MLKLFLKRIAVFLFGFPFLLFAMHITVDFLLNSKSPQEKLFIWGDSQTYFGIDLIALQKMSGKKIYSAATQGASVYDFLVFSEKIPDNSNVIISISSLSRIRRKGNDRNGLAFSLKSLLALSENNYTVKEIWEIILKNKSPKKMYMDNSNSYLYPPSDSIVLSLPLSHFEEYYNETPSFLKDKQNLFLKGIQKLITKKCNITFVEFPIHTRLQEIAKNSPLNNEVEFFKKRISELFEDLKFDTILLDNKTNMMFDLSHFNKMGALTTTEQLVVRMVTSKQSEVYYTVQLNEAQSSSFKNK